jgi:hypothetical protein
MRYLDFSVISSSLYSDNLSEEIASTEYTCFGMERLEFAPDESRMSEAFRSISARAQNRTGQRAA